MRFRDYSVLIGALIAAFASQVHANLLTNGSFESPVVPSDTFVDYSGGSTLITGWTVQGHDVALENTNYSEPINGMSAFNAADGIQSLDLTGLSNTGPTNGVTQTINTIPGVTYSLSFAVGASLSDNGASYYQSTVTDDLSFNDGTTRIPFTSTPRNPGFDTWTSYTYPFIATATTTSIGFFNGTPIGTNFAGLDDIQVQAASGLATWTATGGGSWGTTGNWLTGIVPQYSGDTANFASSITAPSTVDLDGNWTAGNLDFNSINSYTIAPGSGGNLTINNGSNSAYITDSLGTHFISANLILNSNTVITAANGINNLNISGNISGSGGLTITGPGTVVLSGTGNAISSLAINSGSTLDITNTSLLIQYGSNPYPITNIRSYLSSGFNGGTWTGTGLTSSTAASSAGKFAIGYLDGDDNGGTAGQLLLQYALIGDTNLDGTVNLTDLLTLLNSYGESGKDWTQGDFNYDGTVNLTDLLALLNNYGQTANTAATSTQVVPEPTIAGLLFMCVAGLLTRRRLRPIRAEGCSHG